MSGMNMIKLSIVIVNWNVRSLLEECLRSVFQYAPKDSFEVFVVDNASSDGSAEMVSASFPVVHLIKNIHNLGFATACNQAIRQACGEYVLLLNPDCQITADAFNGLVSFFDNHPKAGIVGCRILNADDSSQQSIRRFPTILSQIAMMFKVHHLFPRLPLFQNYLAADFDYSQTQQVDQPMGAVFLLRKSMLDTLGLLDEQFFVWFEEVDLCKRAKDAGWEIWYDADVTVVHYQGQSFKQQDVITKQINSFASCRKYLWKHFRWKSIVAVACMMTYVGLLKIINYARFAKAPLYLQIIGIAGAAELLSFTGYFFEPVRVFGFVFFTLLTLTLSLKRLEYGIAIVLAELLIGSKGHLFSPSINDHDIGVRVGIFCALFLAWIVYVVKNRMFKKQDSLTFVGSSFASWYCLVGIAIGSAVISGVVSGIPLSNVYADANAWIFFFLAFVVWDGIRTQAQFTFLAKVFIAASIVRIMSIVGLFYIMGHKGFGFDVIYSVYRWARTTGLAEITQFDFNVSRVFLQSQIYDVILLVLLAPVCAWIFHKRKSPYVLVGLGVLIMGIVTSLIVSLSRSYWLACIALVPVISFFLFRYYSWKIVIRVIATYALCIGVSLIFLIGVSRFPIPSTEGGF